MSASEIPPPSSPLHGPFRTEIVSDPHTYYAARLDQTERERMEMETSYRVLEMQKRTAEGKRNIQLCRISYQYATELLAIFSPTFKLCAE